MENFFKKKLVGTAAIDHSDEIVSPRRLSVEELEDRIDRIWKITTPPEDFDIRQVVSSAVEQYWSARMDNQPKIFEEDTALMKARTIATLVPLFHEFLADLAASVGPFAILMTIAGSVMAIALIPGWFFTLAFAIVILVGVLIFFAIRNREFDCNFKHSFGSLVGGIIVSASVVILSAGPIKETEMLSLTIAQDTLSNIVISTIVNRQSTGEFTTPTNLSQNGVSLEIKKNLQDNVVLGANMSGLSGKLVADILPYSGSIYLEHPNETRQLRSKFIVGKVKDVSEKSFVIKDSSGKIHTLIRQLTAISPLQNSQVAVAFDPKDNQATNVVLVDTYQK